MRPSRRTVTWVSVAVALLLTALAGLFVAWRNSGLAGTYSSELAKNPVVLRLERNGSYELGSQYPTSALGVLADEQGRWWPVTDHVVVLLPNDTARPLQFARVERRGFHRLRVSENLREVVDTP